MNRAFIDTSYLLALALRKDEDHETAVKWQESYRGTLVTTEYVLVECHDALCQGRFRGLAVSTCDRILGDPSVTVVPASSRLFGLGRELFRSRQDKSWGLTDCISFVVMRDHGLRDALTTDRHFEQAGFRALLRALPG